MSFQKVVQNTSAVLANLVKAIDQALSWPERRRIVKITERVAGILKEEGPMEFHELAKRIGIDPLDLRYTLLNATRRVTWERFKKQGEEEKWIVTTVSA